jgi:hypothetical protein
MKRLIALSAMFTILALVNPLTRADFVLGSGLYDNSAPVFAYSGSWSADVSTDHYGGAAALASASDGVDSLEFSIYGDSFTLFISRLATGGNAQVCIDTICSNLSFFGAFQEYQVAVNYSGLAVAQHDIEILTDSDDLLFDALLVEPVTMPTATATAIPSETPTATPTLEFTETPTATPTLPPWVEYQVTDEVGNEQTVRYTYETTTGEQLLIQIGFGVLIVLLVLVVLSVWRHVDDAD